MFSNGKLRLLMTLVGFERLGMEDVPGASWVVPSAMKSKDLRDTKAIIDQSLEKAATGDDERDPRDLLRRVDDGDASHRAAGDVDFGSESEGEDTVPDGLLFPPNPRSKSNALDELKKKRKKKRDDGHEPLNDETLEKRRRTREENAQSRQAKIKSDLYIHESDEESDDEANEEFFRLEEQRRKEQSERIRKALLLGRADDGNKPDRRKRKSEPKNSAAERKRQRQSPPEASDDSDDDILMTGVRSPRRPASSHGDNEETPDDDLDVDDDLTFSRDRQKEQSPGGAEDEDEEPIAPRRIRSGFVVESDSEDD